MDWIRKVLKLDVALLAVALILAVVLNWSAFVVDCLAIDEHVSFWIADRASPSTLLNRSFHYSATPPLFFLLQQLSLMTFGDREWALRLPAAASFLGAIVAVWWVGRSQLRPLAGGLAALLLATQPASQDYAVVGRPYSLGMLLGVLAIHFTSKLSDQPGFRLRWIAWTLINLALVQTHYLFAALWGAELVWLAWPTAGRMFSIRRIAGAAAIMLVLAATVAPGLLRVWDHRLYLNWTTGTPAISDVWPLVLPVHREWFVHPIWWVLLASPLVWLLVARRASPKHWFEPIPLRTLGSFLARGLIWFALPVSGLWLLGRFWLESLASGRYLVIYVPAATLLLAAVLSSLRGSVAPLLACAVLVLGWQVRPEQGHPIRSLQRQLHRSQSLPSRVDAAWMVTADSIDKQESAWRTPSLSPGEPPVRVRLVLVSSGLAEMTLVPKYLDDPVFHDYVSCRLGRMYLVGGYERKSLPLFWTDDAHRFFRQAIARACATPGESAGSSPESPGLIMLVAATDTELHRASAGHAQALLQAAGAKEQERVQRDGLTWIIYQCGADAQ